MKGKALIALMLGAMAFQMPAIASDDDSETSFGTRYNVGIDKKIAKGFHFYADEEMRLGTKSLDRLYTQAGLTYKICPYLKAGVGYSAISVYKNDDESSYTFDWKHRFTADLTGMAKAAGFKFSLRERFQSTLRTKDINEYQQPQNALALKSRFKVSYDFDKCGLEPYVAVEHRLALNGCKWDSNSTTSSYKTSEYLGNSDVYTSRLRAELGLEWKLSKRSAIEIYGLFDKITDKDIDSKASKAELKKAITTVDSNFGAIGFGYTFSF